MNFSFWYRIEISRFKVYAFTHRLRAPAGSILFIYSEYFVEKGFFDEDFSKVNKFDRFYKTSILCCVFRAIFAEANLKLIHSRISLK